MQSFITTLLPVCVLFLVSYVKAENKVTIIDFKVDVPSNDVIDTWTSDLSNNLLNSNINVKKNCPGLVQADTEIYKDDVMINQMSQNLDKPIKNFEDYKICSSLDSPDLDDDSCSMAEGEQVAKDCDMSGWFSDMDPGDYRIVTNFKQQDSLLSTVTIDIKVESG